MSFFITGTGEVYSGSTQRGVILALLRGVSALAIPFYSVINLKSSYLTEVTISLLFFIVVTLYSPFNALMLSLRKKKIIIYKYNTAKFIMFFAVCNLIFTLTTAAAFFSFFSIIRINGNFRPIIEQGDIAVIKKPDNQIYNKGEMAVIRNEDFRFLRIIGQSCENVSYNKGRFAVDGSELFQSVFTENELAKLSLTDFDVISEVNGNLKYPVIQNKDKYSLNIYLKKNEYFAAPDDRNEISGFKTIKKENICGRMEGIIFSLKRIRFLIKPFQLSE
jgi:hypothetical protein